MRNFKLEWGPFIIEFFALMLLLTKEFWLSIRKRGVAGDSVCSRSANFPLPTFFEFCSFILIYINVEVERPLWLQEFFPSVERISFLKSKIN